MVFFQLCFVFLFISSASAACSQCVSSKAAFFGSTGGLSSGSCGYGPVALNLYNGHVAAAVPSIYKGGEGCGACYQIRCKNRGVCKTTGTTIVVTDLHTDKNNTMDLVLSNKAFRAMALPGKDEQLLRIGIADVEYKRVPCDYKRQKLALRVEKFSNFPNYLAITVLYQGGQTAVLGGDVAAVDRPSQWESLRRNFGAVFDTSRTPKGKLMFRFIVNSGFDAQYFYTKEVLPANWKAGVIYNTSVQITNVAMNGCAPCPWK